jgi:hypothetical protein
MEKGDSTNRTLLSFLFWQTGADNCKLQQATDARFTSRFWGPTGTELLLMFRVWNSCNEGPLKGVCLRSRYQPNQNRSSSIVVLLCATFAVLFFCPQATQT